MDYTIWKRNVYPKAFRIIQFGSHNFVERKTRSPFQNFFLFRIVQFGIHFNKNVTSELYNLEACKSTKIRNPLHRYPTSLKYTIPLQYTKKTTSMVNFACLNGSIENGGEFRFNASHNHTGK